MRDILRMQMRARTTALLVVDVQEKLASVMREEDRKKTVENARILIRGMQALDVPTMLTEQYPAGLGPTVGELRASLSEAVFPIEKTEFDCTAVEGFSENLPSGTRSVVLCGMEAHICILQTAVGLLRGGYDVWVAGDAVCYRDPANKALALRAMEEAGVFVVPTESVLFWLLGKSGSTAFKEISRLIK